MSNISKETAEKLADHFGLNMRKVKMAEWLYGLNVELEHGKKLGDITNLTDDNVLMTAEIALAHIMEYPDYYKRLKKMEMEAEKFWKKKDKNIFI